MIDLKTQLSNFKNLEKLLRKKLGDAEAKTLLFRSVYLISIGSNDYASLFTRNSNVFQSSSQKEYIDMVIGNLTFVIKVIKINNICSIFILLFLFLSLFKLLYS